MKSKLLNGILILSSLIGYLEWGKDKKMFLFQGELEIVTKLFTDPVSVVHPFTLLPLFGQLVLAITLFQKVPGKILTLVGLGCLSLLLVLMFVIGLINLNYKITVSTIPFLVTGVMIIRYHLKNKNQH